MADDREELYHPHLHEEGRLLRWDEDSDHDVNETGHYELMAEAIRELLIEKKVVTADEIREQLEFMDSRGTHLGAKVVAKAWTDPEYKKRLMEDGNAAMAELDIPMGDVELVVVENTEDAHNLVVCTLCSCYPRTILGLPPDWYKSKNYRSRVVNEPRVVLREFGTDLPDSTTVRVHDSNADMRYLVLPRRPEGTKDWSAEQLEGLVTRDSMVGVTTAKSPG